MTEPMDRAPIPGGTVSTIRGFYQAPGLTWITRIVLVAGVAGAVLPGAAGIAVATAAVAAVMATPLLRVAWLIFRWTQEGDRRFILTGIALLGVVLTGAVLSAIGLGR